MARDRIEINPQIMGGKPVIRGTRIPVEFILCKLAAGQSPQKILRKPTQSGVSSRSAAR